MADYKKKKALTQEQIEWIHDLDIQGYDIWHISEITGIAEYLIVQVLMPNA